MSWAVSKKLYCKHISRSPIHLKRSIAYINIRDLTIISDLPWELPAKLRFSPLSLIFCKLLPAVPWNNHFSQLPFFASKLFFFSRYCLYKVGFWTLWMLIMLRLAVFKKSALTSLYSFWWRGFCWSKVTRWKTCSLPFASRGWGSQ